MASWLRYTLAVLGGVAVAVLLISLVQYAGHALYPAAAGADLSTPEAMQAFVAGLPPGAFLFVLASYALGTLGGGFVAARVARARHWLFAGLIGALVLAGAVANFLMIPHPVWFVVAVLVCVPAAAWLAGWLARSAARGARP